MIVDKFPKAGFGGLKDKEFFFFLVLYEYC